MDKMETKVELEKISVNCKKQLVVHDFIIDSEIKRVLVSDLKRKRRVLDRRWAKKVNKDLVSNFESDEEKRRQVWMQFIVSLQICYE